MSFNFRQPVILQKKITMLKTKRKGENVAAFYFVTDSQLLLRNYTYLVRWRLEVG